MKRWLIALTVVVPMTIFAEENSLESLRILRDHFDEKEHPSPEEIQFLKANQTFDFLYAGPLITGGASNLYPGSFSWTPLSPLFMKFHGLWDQDRKSISTTHRHALKSIQLLSGWDYGMARFYFNYPRSSELGKKQNFRRFWRSARRDWNSSHVRRVISTCDTYCDQ